MRNDAKAESPVLWPPHAKSWLIGKDTDAGRDWGQKEKGTTEDELDGWHYQLDGHEFGWTPGVGDGQEGLACCDSKGHKESDTTEWLNWLNHLLKLFWTIPKNLESGNLDTLDISLILCLWFPRHQRHQIVDINICLSTVMLKQKNINSWLDIL